MAQKREKKQRGIWVTNVYFENVGISRQVLAKAIKRGELKFVGSLVSKSTMDSIIQDKEIKSIFSLQSSPFLYYIDDADSFILSYWAYNYKRYLTSIVQVWENLKKQDAHREKSEEELKRLLSELFEGDGQNEYLPSFIREFKKIICQYLILPGGAPLEDEYFYNEFSRQYGEGIAQRNLRFINSSMNIENFLKNENKRKYRQKLREKNKGKDQETL